MSRWLVALSFLLGIFGSPLLAQTQSSTDRVQLMMDKANRLVAVDADGCLATYNKDEITVCGKFDANRKHRLPFPELALDLNKRIRVPIPQGNPEIVQQGRCYVTMNERNCFKGVPLMTVSFGGNGGGLAGPAGRLWRVIEPPTPDGNYVKQAQEQAVDADPN